MCISCAVIDCHYIFLHWKAAVHQSKKEKLNATVTPPPEADVTWWTEEIHMVTDNAVAFCFWYGVLWAWCSVYIQPTGCKSNAVRNWVEPCSAAANCWQTLAATDSNRRQPAARDVRPCMVCCSLVRTLFDPIPSWHCQVMYPNVHLAAVATQHSLCCWFVWHNNTDCAWSNILSVNWWCRLRDALFQSDPLLRLFASPSNSIHMGLVRHFQPFGVSCPLPKSERSLVMPVRPGLEIVRKDVVCHRQWWLLLCFWTWQWSANTWIPSVSNTWQLPCQFVASHTVELTRVNVCKYTGKPLKTHDVCFYAIAFSSNFVKN